MSQEPLFLDRSGVFRRSGRSEMSYVCVPIRAEQRTAGALGRGAALPQGPRLRPRGQVLRARRLDDRPGAARAPPGRGGAASACSTRTPSCARELTERYDIRNLVGNSRPMQTVYEQVAQVAPANTTVLHARRVRHRQGAGGARHPLQLAARQEAVRQGELRRAAREPDRDGAVRPREGRLHRRAQAEKKGRFELAARRHALPRRDRRAVARPTQVKLLRVAAGARVRAAGRRRSRSRSTCG